MTTRRPRDPEIRAIESIVTALDSLDPDAQARVLRYLDRRYDEAPTQPQADEQPREDTP